MPLCKLTFYILLGYNMSLAVPFPDKTLLKDPPLIMIHWFDLFPLGSPSCVFPAHTKLSSNYIWCLLSYYWHRACLLFCIASLCRVNFRWFCISATPSAVFIIIPRIVLCLIRYLVRMKWWVGGFRLEYTPAVYLGEFSSFHDEEV